MRAEAALPDQLHLAVMNQACRAVEVCLKDGSSIKHDDANILVHRVVQTYTNWYRTVGVLTLDRVQDDLHNQVSQHIEEIRVCSQSATISLRTNSANKHLVNASNSPDVSR